MEVFIVLFYDNNVVSMILKREKKTGQIDDFVLLNGYAFLIPYFAPKKLLE